MSNTQLTRVESYDPKASMVFAKVKKYSIPDKDSSKPPMKYQRIFISTKNPDGTVGDLVIPTEEVFSFGISENTDKKSGEVNGFSFPLCLYNREGATPEENKWVEKFNDIVEECKHHLVEVRTEFGEPDLEIRDLKKFNPLYYKKGEDGYPDTSKGPTLYAKIPVKKDSLEIDVDFYDFDDNPVDPETLKGGYCTTVAGVHIHSIYIGAKPSLQIKLYEANVKPVGRQKKRLMGRPVADKRVLSSKSFNPLNDPAPPSAAALAQKMEAAALSDCSSDDAGSLEEESETEVKPKKVVKKVVRRVRKVTRN